MNEDARRQEAYALGAKYGASADAIDGFHHQIGKFPDQYEMRALARGSQPAQAVHLGEVMLRDGEPNKIVNVRKQVWRPDGKNAAPVFLYCELLISQRPGAQFGTVVGMRSPRWHDGDDAHFPMRDADGAIVRTQETKANEKAEGLFAPPSVIRRSATFKPAHCLDSETSFLKATWPSRADGERYASFDANADQAGDHNERAMFFIGLWREFQAEVMGRPVDDLAHLFVDAHAPIAEPQLTREEELERENAQLRKTIEERLAALEASR